MQSWMIGLITGAVMVGWWAALPPWYVSVLLLLPVSGGLCAKCAVARFLCGLAAGCLLGIIYGTCLLDSRVTAACVGTAITVRGHVTSLPSDTQVHRETRRQRFQFTVSELRPERCRGPRHLILSYYGNETIYPGAQWQFEVKLRKPWGLANPGSFNRQQWFSQNAIDAVGSVRNSPHNRLLSGDTGWQPMPERARFDISARIADLPFSPNVIAVLQAITVADKHAVTGELWQLFQQFGINHLLVISGLHIGLVAGAGYGLGKLGMLLLPSRGNRSHWLPLLCSLGLACVYAALAGFSLPTARALCMLACFVAAALVGRKSASANNLLLAAAVILVMNPLAALGSGFWLSFGAVAGLLWLLQWQAGTKPAVRLLQTHAFIALFMAPLGGVFFAGASLVAMPANLVMIPVIGWVVVPFSLLAVLCFWCGWGLESLFWQLAAWPLELLLRWGQQMADTHQQWLYVPLAIDLLTALLALLAAVLLVLPRSRVLKCGALLLALPMCLPYRPLPATASVATHVTVLDVGQGSAVLIRAGRRALLYDTGGGDPAGTNLGSLVVLPFLKAQGIDTLDTLIISHNDLDHSAGLAAVLDAVPVRRLRYGPNVDQPGYGSRCAAGEAWRWPGGQQFQFLSPAEEEPARSNDGSCVLQIQVGEYRLLLPGDIEVERERTLARFWRSSLQSPWLLVGHHGSRTSSSHAFLKQVDPVLAVVSSGYENRFGHPHPAVVARLEERGAMVLSTANSGAIEFTLTPGKPVTVVAYRDLIQRYWL